VEGVSFDAPDGQITGLLGPNGAGKTTTLRILYTLVAPDSGSASIDGLDTVRQSLQYKRRLARFRTATGFTHALPLERTSVITDICMGCQLTSLRQRSTTW
jgi:sodium transport system ATP-binding protein